MKEKSTLITGIILSILIIIIIALSNNLYHLNRTVQSMNKDAVSETPIEESIASIENRIKNLELEMPKDDLNQFIAMITLDLNRTKDLLNKVEGLETVFGKIVALDQSSDVIFEVELVDTQENIQIKRAKNCTVYMAGQYTSVLIDMDEFLVNLEADLESNFIDGFTFKMVDGLVVQIYQGWGELE